MKKRLMLAVCLAGTTLPPVAAAQSAQTPSTMVMSFYRCSFNQLERLQQLTDSILAPVLDEVSNEGGLVGWGVLSHEWADEWNWVTYYLARDRAAFFAAWDEVSRRVSQRHPSFFQEVFDICTEHRDGIYRVMAVRGTVPRTGAAPAPDQLTAAYLAAMRSDLRNLVTAQEAYFADHVTYTTSLSALRFTPSQGVTIVIGTASRTGWNGTARHARSTWRCGIFVGNAPPPIPGQNEGEPRCGQ